MIRTLIKEELTKILSMIHKARHKKRERERERDLGGFTGIGKFSMEYKNPCKYYDIA